MKNFMRYKGVNRIDFSLDEKRNVTVILGDNTVGKTTIAQAFRWCLYEKLLRSKGKSGEDYMLLNQTVMEQMDANSRESVSVDIVLSDEEKHYRISRQVSYGRKVPSTRLVEYQKRLQLFIADRGQENWEEVGRDEPDTRRQETIKNIINELLPDKLSHYFLFDGEKWSDFEYNGTRENIRESVHILTGLSSMQAAMYHLKEMNANSVIGKFRKNITGSGAVYDEIQRDIEREERRIEKLKEKLQIIGANAATHEKKIQQIEAFLLENQNTEALQKQFSTMRTVIQSKRARARDAYGRLVQDYSVYAYMLAAEPLVDAVLQMMKNVSMERRDIPSMKQGTIDFLIKRGVCICGTRIKQGETPYRCLMEQRDYLPPADIGSLLGDFERTARRITIKNKDYYEQLLQEAGEAGRCAEDLENTENELLRLEQQMDSNINFKEYKDQLKFHKGELLSLEREGAGIRREIEDARHTIEKKEKERESLELRNQENEKWRNRVNLAQDVYQKLSTQFISRENKVFMALNERLQANFYRMFNAHDKKIELDKNYNICMYYRTDMGLREETNLSEGEKVARNFAFIVTILEFNGEQKAEGDRFSDTLPIVLDGPFSKLGDENIQLIAACLPRIAEQVILFMLEKDWKYTGLDAYVGQKYRIEKVSEEAFAQIKKLEEG